MSAVTAFQSMSAGIAGRIALDTRHTLHMVAAAKPKQASADMKFNLGGLAFSGLQLSPESIGRRKTILKEVVKGKVWTLDQMQGIINVNGELI
jgi:hypothetical protein